MLSAVVLIALGLGSQCLDFAGWRGVAVMPTCRVRLRSSTMDTAAERASSIKMWLK
jgi:hypothetical protein